MNNWILKQNAYSIIKLMTIFMLLYELVASLIFSIGGKAMLSGYLSGSVLYYVGCLVITYTPKGKMYFSGYFQATLYILLMSRLFNMAARWVDVPVRDRYSAIFVLLMAAVVFIVIGILIGKDNSNGRNKKVNNTAN